MGNSRPRHGFGEVDVDGALPEGEGAPFGEVDLDLGELDPASSERQNTRVTKKLPSLYDDDDEETPVPGRVHEQATRVHDMTELSASTRPPPASALRRAPSAEPAPTSPPSSISKLRTLYADGDADGALEVAAKMAEEAARSGRITPGAARPPASVSGDFPDASVMLEYGEATIDDDLAAVLAAAAPKPRAPQLTLTQRHSIPRIVKAPHEIASLPIDHRGGFLLAHVDGMQTLEEILDVCAMPHAEALEIIGTLSSLGVIVFE